MTDVDWANMPDPTNCYAFGCPAENQLLLHLSADLTGSPTSALPTHGSRPPEATSPAPAPATSAGEPAGDSTYLNRSHQTPDTNPKGFP